MFTTPTEGKDIVGGEEGKKEEVNLTLELRSKTPN